MQAQWEADRSVAKDEFIARREARIERARERRKEARRQRLLDEERERERLSMEMEHKIEADKREAEERQYYESGRNGGAFRAGPPDGQEVRNMGYEPDYSDRRGYGGTRSDEQSWRTRKPSRQQPEDERGSNALDGHYGDQFSGQYGARQDYDRRRDQHGDWRPDGMPSRRGEEIQNADASSQRPQRTLKNKSLAELLENQSG